MADLSELEGLKIELKQVTKEALQLKRDGDLEGAKARVKSIRALKDRIEELEESQPTPDNSAAAAEAAANQARVDELNARITALSKEAVALKRADDMAGAVAKAKEVKELKAELAELEAESSGAAAEAVETERDIAEQAAAMDDVGEVEALIKKTTKQALAKKKAGKTAEAVADMKKIKILQARVEEINAAEEAAAAAAAAAAEAAAAKAAEDAAAAAAAAEAAEAARAARPPSEPPVDVAGGSSATTETASVSTTTTTTTTTAAATAAVTAGAAGGSSSAAGGGVVVEDVVEETTTTTTVTAAASGSSTPAASDGAADEAVAAEEPAPAVVPAPDPHFWEVVLPDPMPPGRDDAIYRDDVNKLDQDFADHRERVGRYIRWREPFVEGFVPPASTAPQITVNIYRSDGTFTPVVIHRDWTFQTILQVYANATELRLIEPFALKHRAPLVPYMDPAYVRPKFFQMYATAAMEDIEDGAELEIRIRFFKLLKPQSDAEALRLIFLQCHRMVLEDIFRYDMKYAVRFAAYFVQQQIGDFDPQRHAPGFLDATMDKLFSPSFLSQRDSRYLQMRVFKTHAQLLGVNAKTAHYSYIATCLTLPTFGGIFYEVETENPDGSMQPCLLGLVHDGVLLYDKGADYPWEFTYWAEIMSYTLDNDTGSFDWTVKIDENTTGVVSVVCDRGQVNKIRENLHDYCALAMLMEKSGEYQTLGTFGPSPKRFLPPATLFVRPPRRLLDSGHLSQTMHFVDTYVDLCRAQNDTPHMSIIRAAENAQDMNDSWKILDLTISNPDVDHLVILGNSFQVNSEYTDGVKDVAITDIIYSRLPFGVDVPSVRKACRVIENIGLYCGIQTLHLSRCGIDGTQEWQAITNAIGRCSALTDLDLSYNEMLPEAMATLNRSIAPETGQRLKKLDVTNCALVDEAAAPLGGILHNMRDTLITIKAGRNNWTDRGLKVILAHYKKNTVAHELDLTGATWGKESLKILDELLRMEHGSVTNWYIGGIDVQKKQAKLLAEALETTYLTKLDLRNSAIKGKLMQKFIPLIPESHLIYLNLSGNQFDKGCTKAMVAVLASSGCKLQEFLLRSCELPIKLAKAIIGSLEHNATLYKLDLADNGLNSEIAEAIVAAVRMNTSLRHLVLSFNPIGNAGTKALAPLLEENGSCLEQFEMVQVGMKDGGVAALGVALETNVWLKELHVEQNSMGKNGFIHLIKSLKENTCLREVHVRGNDDETIADLLPKLPPIKAKVVI